MSIDPSEPCEFDPTSEDTTSSQDREPSSGATRDLSSLDPIDWDSAVASLVKQHGRWTAKRVYGVAGRDGGVYRWGIAAATGSACDEVVEVFSRLACGAKVSKKRLAGVDLPGAASDWLATSNGDDRFGPIDAAYAILWAAALPALRDHLDDTQWRAVLVELVELQRNLSNESDSASPLRLMVGGELGLTLACRFAELEFCSRLQNPSLAALRSWVQSNEASVSAAVASPADVRLILASLIRVQRLTAAEGIKLGKRARWKEVGESLATWVAALTTKSGRSGLSPAPKSAVVDDCAEDGLFDHAIKFDRGSLKPAFSAALGNTPRGGRLAWEVSLPEAFHHDPDAKICAMFPEWDECHGRMHIGYGQTETRLELFAGSRALITGPWDTMLEIDGRLHHPDGQWEEVCEHSDDDVHYLEIEQHWTGGWLLQRQILLIREDRCVLLADAVLPAATSVTPGTGTPATTSPVNTSPVDIGSTQERKTGRTLRYTCRLPIAARVAAEAEEETREIVLAKGQSKAMFIPLAAGEWRVGASSCTLSVTEDQHLSMTREGVDRLYAPLWIDTAPRRFKRKRTWRQLTVADQLRIVEREEATGYRIQMGSEQWMVYRSLSDRHTRTVLGKHLIADFYCCRFDPGDGSHEELITVDEGESDDDG